MNIDENTGLPELPEPDLFWRVKPYAVEIWRNLPDGDWLEDVYFGYLTFDLQQGYQYDTEHTWRPVETTWYATETRWFKPITVKHVEVTQKRFTRRTNRKSRVISIDTDKTGETETVPGYWVPGDSYSWGSRPGYRTTDRNYDLREPVTQNTVLVLSEKALKTYLDSKSAKDLIGDYPPKKLEN